MIKMLAEERERDLSTSEPGSTTTIMGGKATEDSTKTKEQSKPNPEKPSTETIEGKNTIEPKTVVKNNTREGTKGRRKKATTKNGETYSHELRSRFGEAFLPFASKMESIERERIMRKRKGKNKKKQPPRLSTIPMYKKNKENRMNKFEQQ